MMLTDLANWLRDGGCTVREFAGWQTRVRGGGPYKAMPLCVVWHHTASPPSWNGTKEATYLAIDSPVAPTSNLYIDRQGIVWVLAAGPSNTNGAGKAMTFSRGTVPMDGMNSRAVGIECGNNGVGEIWPREQIDSLFRASNIINAHCGNRPEDITSHHEYAPTRKVDPATTNIQGPWVPRSINKNGTWNLLDMRAEAIKRSMPDIHSGKETNMHYPCEGLWRFQNRPEVFAVYAGGYKTWISNPAELTTKQALMRLTGVNDSINTQNDEGMFRAFGQVMGVVPDGLNEWGLPL